MPLQHRVLLPCIALIAIIGTVSADAQNADAPSMPELLESIINDLEIADGEDEELLSRLEQLARSPIDLRRATADDLLAIPTIDLLEARAIVGFIARNPDAGITTLVDSAVVSERIGRLLQVVARMGAESTGTTLHVRLRSRAVHDLELRDGYRSMIRRVLPAADTAEHAPAFDTVDVGTTYLGSPLATTWTLEFDAGRLGGALVVDKDAGEAFLVNDTLDFTYSSIENAAGIDDHREQARIGGFVGGSLWLTFEPDSTTSITGILGDFRPEYGAGMVFGRTGGFTSTATRFSHRNRIRASSSTSESGFLRGAAISTRTRVGEGSAIRFDLFASARRHDATISTIESDYGGTLRAVTSVRTDGYRRTRGELRRSANLGEYLLGAALGLRRPQGAINVSGYIAGFDTPVEGFSGARRDVYSSLFCVGVDGHVVVGNAVVFAEVARGRGGSVAVTSGVNARLGGYHLDADAYHTPDGYTSAHSTGQTIGDRRPAERGIAVRAAMPVSPAIRIEGTLEICNTPRGTGSVNFPGTALDCSLDLRYRFAPRAVAQIRLSQRTRREEYRRAADNATAYVDNSRSRCRFDLEYSFPRSRGRIRTRLERNVQPGNDAGGLTGGSAVSADVRLSISDRLEFQLGVAGFRTDGFDAAIYRYDGGLPGRFRIIALHGDGSHLGIGVRWRPADWLSISASLSRLHQADRRSVGSGAQEVDGPVASTVGVQVEAGW